MTQEYVNVPMVLFQSSENFGNDFYQVYIGEYCTKDHDVTTKTDDYVTFSTMEEVEAYIKGLKKSGYVK